MRFLCVLLLILLLPVAAQAQITQREWALQLIDSLGWSFGLPEEPTDEDYALLLSGRRTFRVEAEDSHQRGDRVSVMQFDTFGEFSGTGWVNGIKDRTDVHLRFHLPHSGRYKLTARVRMIENHLLIGTRDFRVSGGDQFTTVDVGHVELNAGAHEALMRLRPNASIDYFELEAAPLGPIEPEGGWDFDAQLTAGVAARTAIQALRLQHMLPPGREVISHEAENLPLPRGVRVGEGSNKGEASGNRYVEIGAAPVELQFLVTSAFGGVYDLVLRAAGQKPIRVKLDGFVEKDLRFAYQFADRNLGTFFLPEGESHLRVLLPPGSSIDRLVLQSRRGSYADLLRLAGLSDTEEMSRRDLNNLSALIYRLKSLR